ncbi:MAG: SH3 domain-containing protein [Oscillospiraceae bacterium]|nr:SH3 domain-containing protein [Oscillospiraceae bacterium]
MRRKTFRTLLAALLIASTLSATAFAETALVTGSEVNVRSGPGSDYAILGSCTRGSTVDVIDRGDGTWYAVNYNGSVGYMFSQYLSLQSSGSGGASAAPGQAVISDGTTILNPGVSSSSSTQTNGVITGMYVRFRSGPTSDSAILEEYNQGKAVTILGTEGDWTLCCIDGQYGYIFSSYVTATSAASAAGAAATPAPDTASVGIVVGQSDVVVQDPAYGQTILVTAPVAPTPTLAPAPTGTTSGISIVLVTPSPAPAVGTTAQAGVSGTITGDYVRFRRGPGTGYSIICSYDRGQAVSVLGVEGDWVYCRIEGETGYVFAQYVKTTAASAASDPVSTGGQAVSDSPVTVPVSAGGQTVLDPTAAGQSTVMPTPAPTSAAGSPGYIKGNNVRFRAGPDLSADIIGELYYGNVVTITGTDGTWTSLICEGKAGYVFSQYVAPGVLQAVSSAGSASGREVADYALQYVGTPYRWGGVDPATGFDCSGFAYYVYKHFGYTLNRVASEQALNGRHVEAANMQPGDLLCFYSGGSYIGHVGIYIGNNLFVHAATSSTGVITSELTGYYAKRGFEVRRILN